MSRAIAFSCSWAFVLQKEDDEDGERVTSSQDGLALPKGESSPSFTGGPHCAELGDPERPEP